MYWKNQHAFCDVEIKVLNSNYNSNSNSSGLKALRTMICWLFLRSCSQLAASSNNDRSVLHMEAHSMC
jgi:hypothetical protein